MSINRVELTGNIAGDADLRMTPGGTAILEFAIAVNDRRRRPDGEWEGYANFIDCRLFGRRAESLQKYMTKGVKVAVAGKLRKNVWEDRETGQTRSRVEVVVDDVDFMQRRGATVTDDDAALAATVGPAPADIPF